MDMAKVGLLGLTATLLLGAARFDLAVAQDVAPKVERTVEKSVAIEAKANSDVAEIKAKADKAVAEARAKAAAETDPARKDQYRKEAEKMAGEATRMKADAERLAARVRTRAAEARRMDSDMQRAAMASSEAALARTQEALARQAQTQAGDKADPGKQQLMQLMADSVAVARQEMAKARLQADEDAARAREMADTVRNGAMPPDSHASASSSQSAESSTNGVSTIRRSHKGDGKDDNVSIDVQINGGASGKIMGNAKARQTLDETIRTAVAEARSRINAAIARANAEVGATADKAGEDSNVDLNWRYAPDRMAPAPRALPAPPPPAPLPPPPAPSRPLN